MSNAAPNAPGAPWGPAPEPAGDEAAGFTLFGIDFVRVAKVPFRRWPITLVCLLVCGGIGYLWGTKNKVEVWSLEGTVNYVPLEVEATRKVYTPQTLATVVSLIKARTNFEKLCDEFELGVAPDLLANRIFKLPQQFTESNAIPIGLEWEDRNQGERMVNRLIEIATENVKRQRRSFLSDLVGDQEKKLRTADKQYAEAKAAAAGFLRKAKINDIKAELDDWNKRRNAAETAVEQIRKELSGLKLRIQKSEEQLERLKQEPDKGNEEAATEAFLKSQREMKRQIAEVEGNLNTLRRQVQAAKKKLDLEQDLYAKNARSRSEVEEARSSWENAKAEEKRVAGQFEFLQVELKNLKKTSATTLSEQDTVRKLKAIDLPILEAGQERAQSDLRVAQRNYERIAETQREMEPYDKAIKDAEKDLADQTALLQAIRSLRDAETPELRIIAPAKAGTTPQSSNAKKLMILWFLVPFLFCLVLLVGYEMTTPAWRAESLAEKLKLPLLARSGSRAGALTPNETRGLSLRVRQYVPDAGGVILLSTLNDDPNVDQMVSDLSRFFAARDEKVLILDARIAKTEGDKLPRLLGRQVVHGPVEVVPDGHSTGRGKVGSVVVSGLVQYLVFEGIDPARFISATRIPAVDYMAAGGPYALTDVLASQPMKDLLDTLRRKYSLVLVVGPSVAKSIDTEILAAYVNGIVFVINAPMKTATPPVQDFLLSLKEANAPLMGSVVCM